MTLRIGSLFSGYGGLDLAVQSVYDAEHAWFCEFDPAPSRILAHHWPDVPNLKDVTAVDWATVEPIDILTGGFPCQDVSVAGRRAGMTDGTRSGLWSHMVKAIDALRPGLVVIENVGGLFSAKADSRVEPCEYNMGDADSGGHAVLLRALDSVLGTLATLGYDAEWVALRAADVGAPHGRLRVFITAHPSGGGGGGRATLPLAGGTGEPDVAAVGADPRPGPSGDTPGLTLLPTPMTSYSGRDVETWRAQRPAGNGKTRQAVGDLAIVAEQLLPTPVSQPSGNTPEEHLRKKPGREVVTDLSIIAENGLFQTGGQLLPTPRAADSTGVRGRTPNRSDAANAKAGLTLTDACQDAFGPYAAAIQRWEQMLGRTAPDPTEPGKNRPRLASRFVEFLMGLDDGHVTGVGLTRPQELKALGNGVVPQQGAAALAHLHAIRSTNP